MKLQTFRIIRFDDEMGKNQKAIKVLQRLFDAGYGTEKEIVNMTMDEMLALPGVNVVDLCIISELQKSIKANKVISYLSEKTEAREETKGADFDDEMGKNQKAIKVLQRLFDAGYGTEKEIVNMTMDEMLALPGVNVVDLCIISELQKSIKANKVISYLSEKTEAREETKGADYGGTT